MSSMTTMFCRALQSVQFCKPSSAMQHSSSVRYHVSQKGPLRIPD
jgi:hypothetical protein